MWVMSLTVHCPWLWHLIPEPPLPSLLSWPCHLYRPQYTSHPCNYFTGFFFFLCCSACWFPGSSASPLLPSKITPKGVRAGHVSSFLQWPQPRSASPLPSPLSFVSQRPPHFTVWARQTSFLQVKVFSSPSRLSCTPASPNATILLSPFPNFHNCRCEIRLTTLQLYDLTPPPSPH